MALNPGRTETIGVDELRALETSVVKSLCLTINTAGSELKYKILDSLSEDDFYFPMLRAVFRTLSDMHLRGDYVISANLEEELHKSSIEMPAGFTIEQLFEGNLPSLPELNGWVARLKERSKSGLIPSVKAVARPAAAAPPAYADATVVKSVEEVKKRIAEEMRKAKPPAQAEESARRPLPPPEVRAAKAKPPPTPTPRELPAPAPAPSARAGKPRAVLASEGDDWSDYLQDLAAQQGKGKRFDTGFSSLDRGLGGLSPGLMILVDENRDRIVSFLKQLMDQVAAASEARCLYVSSELPKSSLRLRTLSRLAGIPSKDLEKGRLKKDSPDWKRVDSAGRSAARWLKRVFVYEAHGELETSLVRDLIQKLQPPPEKGTCLVAIDSLERIRSGGTNAAAVSQLKALADSLDVLILAATSDPTLLASKEADYASVFRQAGGAVELEVLRAGKEESVIVRFLYEPGMGRFTER